MKSTGSIPRYTEIDNIRQTLRKRLSGYFYRLYTFNVAAMVSRDVKVATGQFIPASTISKWLYQECSPSPERQVLLDITYQGITDYLHAPFRDAHKSLKERELEAIIAQNTQQLEELRAG